MILVRTSSMYIPKSISFNLQLSSKPNMNAIFFAA